MAGQSSARGSLSREKILRTAIRLADRDSLDVLSMRRLATELGVEAMSLYHHVENKDALLDGMVDKVAAEIDKPSGDDWRAAMRRRAHSMHDVLLRHRWATMPLVSRVNDGPEMLSLFDASVGCLVAAGFSYPLADRALNAIDSHVYGFTLLELNFPFAPDEYASAAREYLPGIPGTMPHLRAMARLVADREYDGVQAFDFGLEIVLEGLEREMG